MSLNYSDESLINDVYISLNKHLNDSELPKILEKVLQAFRNANTDIQHTKKILLEKNDRVESNKILAIVAPELKNIGFDVETGKKKKDKLQLKSYSNTVNFQVDAWNKSEKCVVEIEAGRAFANNQHIKDFYEVCVAEEEIEYLCIAVRNKYRDSYDFLKIIPWYLAIQRCIIEGNMYVKLKGILLIVY